MVTLSPECAIEEKYLVRMLILPLSIFQDPKTLIFKQQNLHPVPDSGDK
jgi:hypothetical protein